nr:nucleoside hydrolase [Clostridia bacterium]
MKNIYDILAQMTADKPKRMILDTDTFNEVDDQFALAYAMLLSKIPERKLELLSVNAAPFLNKRSTSPLDGMQKSYDEIKRIVGFIDSDSKIPIYAGSAKFMESKDAPEESPAARNIIDTALASDDTLYVVTIGAPTNVAAAITLCPEIKEKIVVVWLAGNALHWPTAREFNMVQDIKSSQIILDSGVPVAIIPCMGVCSALTTTIPELEYYLRGKNKLCDYLIDIVADYPNLYGWDKMAWSKVIWDVSAVACLMLPNSIQRVVIPTPRLTDDCSYVQDYARHPWIYVRHLNRDVIFADLFRVISSAEIK